MAPDTGCICEGNWRELVVEHGPLIGRLFAGPGGGIRRFVGLLHSDDDYYFAMVDANGKLERVSCVGSLSLVGYEPMA